MKTFFARKPAIAGVILLALNLPVFAIETVVFIKATLGGLPEANAAIVFMALSAPAVIAGFCALFRRVWWLALTGSILALSLATILATPPLLFWLDRAGTPINTALFWLGALITFAATALITFSKGEFTRNKK